MFIQSFEANWIDHPFWRPSFFVVDESIARRIRAAGIIAVVIDESRGVRAPCRSPGRAAARGCNCKKRSPVKAVPQAVPNLSAGEVHSAAVGLLERTRGAIYELYQDANRGIAPTAATLEPLVRDITECVQRSRQILHHLGLLRKKDEYTFLHSLSVCSYMVNFARHLGFEDDAVMRLGMAGLMHDVGKAEIDEAILMKPGRLTAEEFHIVRQHPGAGHALLQTSEDLPEEVLSVCLQHHERLDGKGYPHGLVGTQISLAVRMATICDVYDALTSERPYKEAWLPARALREMRSSEEQFDQVLLTAFVESLHVPRVSMRRQVIGPTFSMASI